MKCLIWLVSIVGLAVCPAATADKPLIERLDHFYIDSSSSLQLYEFLNGELGLPVVWPYSDYGRFASGGLSAGNVVIETLRFEDSGDVARVSGVAYLPVNDAETTSSVLDELGIERGKRYPFTIPSDNGVVTLWENVSVSGLSSDNLRVFFCDYKDRQGVSAGQLAASEELRASSGGPLGVVGVSEIVIGTTRFDATVKELQNIGLERREDNSYSVPDGVAVRVVASQVDMGLGFSLEVRSLEQATSWLKENGYLGETESGLPVIENALLGDVEITLVQDQPIN